MAASEQSVSSPIEQLIPHRAPFRFVDELVWVRSDEAEAELRLHTDDDRLHLGAVQPLYLLEALAQSAAAFHAAQLQSAQTEATAREEGFLALVESATFHGAARAGDCVRLHVRRERTFGAMVRFLGQAMRAECGSLLVSTSFTVARTTGTAASS